MARKNGNREEFVPYDKLSKKKKKEFNNKKRNDWGDFNPATKVIPNKRRQKKKRDDYYEDYYDEDY